MLYESLKVTISGSYRKFPDEVQEAITEFQDYGATILSPKSTEIVSAIDGFVSLKGDPITQLKYLPENFLSKAMQIIEDEHLWAIKNSNLLWLVLPEGYCGLATAFETGWALAHNIPVYTSLNNYLASKEPIVKSYSNPALNIADVVTHYDPDKVLKLDDKTRSNILNSLAQSIVSSQKTNLNATVAVGAMIVDYSQDYPTDKERDILLVNTYKWQNRYSIVGGRVNKSEKLNSALEREVKEQTKFESVIGNLLCTFDELPQSGYFMPGTERIFIDRVVKVKQRKAVLNQAAEDYIWIPPKIALRDLDIEPNARNTIEAYLQSN